MLNLIRADLYRISRPRGLRGSLWQYGLALIGVYAVVIGTMLFAKTQSYAEMSGGNVVEIPTDFASYTSYLANMMLAIVSLCVSFMVAENALQDFKFGYAKSVLSARAGRLSYFLGKVLFAGVVSAIVMVIAMVTVTAGAIIGGYTYAYVDGPLELAGWFAGFWLNTWAMAVITLVIVYATRVSPLSYIGAFILYTGVVPTFLRGLAHSSGGVLSVLEPFAPAFETLAAWMPTSALSNLEAGGRLFFLSAADVWGEASRAFVVAPGAQAILTGVIWIAIAGAVVLAIARRRDI